MMKVAATCGECLYGRPGPFGPEDLPIDFDLEDAPFSEKFDDYFFSLRCKNGHSIDFLLANEKFEILFDYACHAMLDGYYREAIVAFAASLERFYEFSLRSLLFNRGVSGDDIDIDWELVKGSSGKQLGAISFVYLYVTKKAFPRIPKHLDGLRNHVVHKGKFPSKDEAISYGEAVRSSINSALAELKRVVDLAGANDQKFLVMKDSRGIGKQIRFRTILDVRDGPVFRDDDDRNGDLKHQLARLEKTLPLIIGL